MGSSLLIMGKPVDALEANHKALAIRPKLVNPNPTNIEVPANARYQRNALVMGLAQELGIEVLYLPSYTPNLDLFERLWRFV